MVSARGNSRGSEVEQTRRRPLGVSLLVAFFTFGASMALLAALTLVFPGSALDSLWRFNPEARVAFRGMGPLAIALMAVVSTACAVAAIGLAKLAPWGRALAIGVLTINLLGEASAALIRHDRRTLIGLPIGGAMIVYLLSKPARNSFGPSVR
jgi:hypothetical protein